MRAYCYRSGLIAFGASVPQGAIQIARGKARHLREAVSELARHSRTGNQLIVPGIPEAGCDATAAGALENFIDRVATAIARKSAPHG